MDEARLSRNGPGHPGPLKCGLLDRPNGRKAWTNGKIHPPDSAAPAPGRRGQNRTVTPAWMELAEKSVPLAAYLVLTRRSSAPKDALKL